MPKAVQVETKLKEGCKRSLEITLPSERADRMYEELLAEYRRSLRLPGFRRGRVPESMIRRRFDGELRQEVINKIIPEALQEAIRAEKLDPVERPTIEDVHYKDGEPLRITASFETRPDIELKAYTDLTVKIEKKQYDVTGEQIDVQLEYLRLGSATFKLVERDRALAGDFAAVDIRGEPQIEEASPFRREDVIVEVEEEGGFQGRLIGARVGKQEEFVITHPADFGEPALAGKTVQYTVDVRELRERVLPDLDDEFARDLGEFSGLDELKKELKQELEERAENRRRTDAAEKLLEAIAESNPSFDLPQVMIQRQMSWLEEDLRRQFSKRGLDPDHIGFDWKAYRERERPGAEWSVRKGLFLDALAEREGIKVSNKEVEKEVAGIAASQGQDPHKLRKQMTNNGSLDYVRTSLRDRAVKAWLIEHNTVREV